LEAALRRFGTGGAPITLFAGSGNAYSQAITVNSTQVYWASVDRQTLASGVTLPVGLAVDAADVYWTSFGKLTDPAGVSGAVAKVPLSGGPVVTLAHRLGNPRSIALGGTSVLWAQDYGEGKVTRIAKDPCRSGACVE
jgi:hypothetical protein